MRRGESWEEPARGAPDRVVEVSGGDPALAAAHDARPDAVVRFLPDTTSDLARALGLGLASTPDRSIVACDVLATRRDLAPARETAVNAVVLGIPPDRLRAWHRRRAVRVTVDGRAVGTPRASTVVIANGQFLRGSDLVPRGHPGDGRAEVQIYALAPKDRRLMRARLATGDHVPHPHIVEVSGRNVVVEWTGRGGARPGAPIEIDGHRRGRVRRLLVDLVPSALRVRC